MTRLATRFRPAVEPLEDRLPLAGNVTAVLSDGSLFITGDDAANDIRITPGPDGALEIAGQGGTLVNGQAAAQLAGVTGDVEIRLGDGNDTASLLTGSLPGSVLFRGGPGDDDLIASSLTVEGNLKFRGDDGNDQLITDGLTVNGNLKFHGDEGNDEIIAAFFVVHRDLKFRGDHGIDRFIGSSFTITRDLKVRGDRGNDELIATSFHVVGDLKFRGDDGEDRASMVDAVIDGDLVLDLGPGAISQRIFLGDFQIDGNLIAESSGASADNFTVEDSFVDGSTTLKLGGGNDSLLMNDSDFGGPFVAGTGGGNDTVTLDANNSDNPPLTFHRPVHFRAGAGDDTFFLGSTGDSSAEVVFRARATFDGRDGANVLRDRRTVKEGPFVPLNVEVIVG